MRNWRKSYSSYQNWIVWVRWHLFNYYIWGLLKNLLFGERKYKNKLTCDPPKRPVPFYNTGYSLKYNNVIFSFADSKGNISVDSSLGPISLCSGELAPQRMWGQTHWDPEEWEHWCGTAGPEVVPRPHLQYRPDFSILSSQTWARRLLLYVMMMPRTFSINMPCLEFPSTGRPAVSVEERNLTQKSS